MSLHSISSKTKIPPSSLLELFPLTKTSKTLQDLLPFIRIIIVPGLQSIAEHEVGPPPIGFDDFPLRWGEGRLQSLVSVFFACITWRMQGIRRPSDAGILGVAFERRNVGSSVDSWQALSVWRLQWERERGEVFSCLPPCGGRLGHMTPSTCHGYAYNYFD